MLKYIRSFFRNMLFITCFNKLLLLLVSAHCTKESPWKVAESVLHSLS